MGSNATPGQAGAVADVGDVMAGQCKHLNHVARCDVHRLVEPADGVDIFAKAQPGNVVGFTLDLQVCCADCQMPFRFIGLPGGYGGRPTMSPDGLEARLPMEPADGVLPVGLD